MIEFVFPRLILKELPLFTVVPLIVNAAPLFPVVNDDAVPVKIQVLINAPFGKVGLTQEIVAVLVFEPLTDMLTFEILVVIVAI